MRVFRARFKHAFFIALTIGLVAMCSLLGFWAVLDGTAFRPIVEFQDPLNLRTEKDTYKPGDLVRVYVTYCKYRDITPTYDTAMIDDHLILFQQEHGSSGFVGCKNNVLVNFETIPPDTYSTSYHFNRILHYQTNPARTIDIRLQTSEFKVIH